MSGGHDLPRDSASLRICKSKREYALGWGSKELVRMTLVPLVTAGLELRGGHSVSRGVSAVFYSPV